MKVRPCAAAQTSGFAHLVSQPSQLSFYQGFHGTAGAGIPAQVSAGKFKRKQRIAIAGGEI